ncbi:hypothetical protein K4H03_23185, partial [Mycobacterium tuberculosis]|nr:hypothetical protein [Mycobacterium tuberculosis]
ELTDDDDALERIITAIADRLDADSQVLNPVDQDENLNRLSAQATANLRQLLRELEETARRANAATNEATAAEIWTEAFEHFCPMPEDFDKVGDSEDSGARTSVSMSTAVVAYT